LSGSAPEAAPTPPTAPATGGPSFFAFTTHRPVAVTMMVVAAVVFGLVGLRRLPVNLLPDISYPTVTVRTQYPGSSPEDVEERISERIQEAVSVVPGVRRVVSISRAEVSDVVLEFDWGTAMVFAISDVRERLDRVFLPREAERPLVLRYDPSLDPVLTIGLSGELDLVELRRIAEDELERELAKVEGVAAVKVRGGDEEEIRIQLDENAMTVLGLDAELLGQRLAAENINSASGSIDEGKTEFLVRTLGEYRNLDEIGATIVERRNDTPIRLRDVARVVRVPRDKEVISRVDGRPCVLVDVYKEANANVVQLARSIKERTFGSPAQQRYVAGLGPDGRAGPAAPAAAPDASPAEAAAARAARVRARTRHRQMTDFIDFGLAPLGVRLDLLQDQSTFIETSIADVRDAAVVGGLFAIAVIFLFLRRLAATVILAVSIPISLVASFAPMFLSDITLNIMSLGGLALGVGMLVDNSIVVLEAITRAREDGRPLRAAAIEGVGRVAGAVTASTLTTVAVFFPIVFVEGVAGQLFRDQALTVVYSLLMSLLVALFVIPMLASRDADDGSLRDEPRLPRHALARGLQRATALGLRAATRSVAAVGRLLGLLIAPVLWVFDRSYRAVEAVYPRLLRGALRLRVLVLLAAIGLSALAVDAARGLGSELLPEVSQGELFVELFLPRDATVERTDAVAAPLERAIAALPGVRQTFLAVGVDKEELNSSEEGEHSAKILVRLATAEDPAAAEEALRAEIRELLRRTPEVMGYRFSRPSVLAFATPMIVEVVGKDLLALRQVSATVEQAMTGLPGLRDVRSTQQRGNPEIVLRLDRDRMSALGIDSGMVARILATKVQGDVPTRFAERDRKIDMRVAVAREELDRVQRLLDLNVNPDGNPEIPLESIAEVRILEGPSEIRRLGNTRGAEIQAAVQGFDYGSTQAAVEDLIATVPTPPGIEVRIGGQKDEMARSMDSVYLALGLAIFLVYVVMASQFESLIQPFVILCSLPLAFVGVIFALLALEVPLSVIALLGGIVLAGIVVNNAIILVDQINKLRLEGLPKQAAIVEGARTRLRPVLMTTTTTVLGLLPLTGWLSGMPLLGGSEGLELRAPLAITVVAGLVSSTLLTLLVIPCVYSMSDRRS
jgi:HAE1 family hydrophobic/amphiphilic exporter-1